MKLPFRWLRYCMPIGSQYALLPMLLHVYIELIARSMLCSVLCSVHFSFIEILLTWSWQEKNETERKREGRRRTRSLHWIGHKVAVGISGMALTPIAIPFFSLSHSHDFIRNGSIIGCRALFHDSILSPSARFRTTFSSLALVASLIVSLWFGNQSHSMLTK